MHEMAPQEIANLAWALATMHIHPGLPWVSRLLQVRIVSHLLQVRIVSHCYRYASCLVCVVSRLLQVRIVSHPSATLTKALQCVSKCGSDSSHLLRVCIVSHPFATLIKGLQCVTKNSTASCHLLLV